MEDFVQKFQEHADRVCEILQKETEWIKRYKGYADTLHNRNNDRLKFRCPGELFPYINITTAIQNSKGGINSQRKYFLRYLGQNVADILVSNKTGEVTFSTKQYSEKNDKYFGYKMIHENDNWQEQAAKEFREHFKTYRERNDEGKRNEEHRIQNLLLRELAKKKGEEKYIRFIQPVRLQRCFLEIPTPLTGSTHDPKYAKQNGGGIDILARVGHGRTTRLGVIEVKDENKPGENIFDVLNQAVTYACFIHKLLRSESGKEWCRLFGYSKPEEILCKPIIIDAIAAMPDILPKDTILFQGKKRMRVKVGEDLIELHFISFEDNKAENKLENIKNSLRKNDANNP